MKSVLQSTYEKYFTNVFWSICCLVKSEDVYCAFGVQMAINYYFKTYQNLAEKSIWATCIFLF